MAGCCATARCSRRPRSPTPFLAAEQGPARPSDYDGAFLHPPHERGAALVRDALRHRRRLPRPRPGVWTPRIWRPGTHPSPSALSERARGTSRGLRAMASASGRPARAHDTGDGPGRAAIGTVDRAGGSLLVVSTPDRQSRATCRRGRSTSSAAADLSAARTRGRTRGCSTHAGIARQAVALAPRPQRGRRACRGARPVGGGATVAVVSDAGTPAVVRSRRPAGRGRGRAPVSAVDGRARAQRGARRAGGERACRRSGSASRASWPGEGATPAPARGRSASRGRTTLIYEAPDRLAGTLADLAAACGRSAPVVGRPGADEAPRGGLAGDPRRSGGPGVRSRRGPGRSGGGPGRAAPPCRRTRRRGWTPCVVRSTAGASWRDAAGAVAAELGVSRRRVYDHALALRASGSRT